jgi:hypothetical protein
MQIIVKNDKKSKKMTKNDKKQQKMFIFLINHLTYYMITTYNNPHYPPISSGTPFSRRRSGDAIESMNNEQRTMNNLTPYKLTRYASRFTRYASRDTRYMLYICRDSSSNPTFLCKTNPILCVFSPKTTISPKNKPKTNPNKPNTKPILTQKSTIRGVYPDLSGQNKPNQTQFLPASPFGGFKYNTRYDIRNTQYEYAQQTQIYPLRRKTAFGKENLGNPVGFL